jgi:hypothetical protein
LEEDAGFSNITAIYSPPPPVDRIFHLNELSSLQLVTRRLLTLSVLQAKARILWLKTMKISTKDSKYNVEIFLISQTVRKIAQSISDYSSDRTRICQTKLEKEVSEHYSLGLSSLYTSFKSYVDDLSSGLFIASIDFPGSQICILFQNIINSCDLCLNALLSYFISPENVEENLISIKDRMRDVSISLEDLVLTSKVDHPNRVNFHVLLLFLDSCVSCCNK